MGIVIVNPVFVGNVFIFTHIVTCMSLYYNVLTIGIYMVVLGRFVKEIGCLLITLFG